MVLEALLAVMVRRAPQAEEPVRLAERVLPAMQLTQPPRLAAEHLGQSELPRVPALLLMSGSGMAAGTWLAGVMYDHFGFYAPAFAAGVLFNLMNLAVLATLVLRRRYGMQAAA
jgi:hypothetical protein